MEGAPEHNGAIYVPITAFSEDRGRRWIGKALLDTGAQFAMAHPEVIAELGLVARGESDIDTALGRSRARAFVVPVRVADIFDDVLSVLESPSRERFVLGRQFLQGMKLSADWQRGEFSIARGP